MRCPFRFFFTLCAAFMAIIAQSSRAQTHLLFTSDTQGHVGPCQSCPGAHGLGSLARRTTLINQLRAKEPGLLLLDAGNALFGDESMPSGGKVIAAAYDAMGYDAANIGYRDFRLGKAATLASLDGAKFVPLSANLLDAQTGQLLFKPYIVKQAGAEKIAIIGATESPAALAILPELGKQLDGVKIQFPAEALAAIVPKAKAEASRVVLLYYGSTAGIAPIRKQFDHSIDLILLGGSQPGEIPEGGTPPLFSTFSHGRQVADITFVPNQPAQLTQWAVVADYAPDPGMKTLIANYPTKSAAITLAKAPDSARAGNTTISHGIDRIEAGKTERLNTAGRNSAIELSVKSVSLLDKLGDATAPEGMLFLVIEAQFRNLQPPQLVDGQSTPAQYQVPNLTDNLYGVANDSRVLKRPRIDAGGLLSFDQLSLEKQNDTIGGKIVYEVSRNALPADVKLRFYDFAHGNIVVPILSSSFDGGKAISPPQHNQVIDGAVFAVQKSASRNGQNALAGRTFVNIELRGRSTMVTRADAAAFDFHAKPGTKIDVGTIADWKESRKYVQLVLDGEYSYAPLPDSAIPEEPRFLPDVMTGGTLSFVVPAGYKSMQLRCDFPNAALPDGSVVRPPGLTFAIEGTRATLPERIAIAHADDEVFDLSIVGQQASNQFAGTKADDGQQFIAITATVKNHGSKQEFFVPKDQLKYVTASGGQDNYDDLTLQGPRPPGEQMYIPPGEQRTFQLVYRESVQENKPRVAYAAVTEGASKVMTLSPLTQIAAAPGQSPAPSNPTPTPNPAPMKTVADANPPPTNPPSNAPANAGPILKPRPHGPARGIAGVGLTAEQVNAAIDRGMNGLWKYIKENDLKDESTWFGQREPHYLCALALIHAGAAKKIPEFDAALRGLIDRSPVPPSDAHPTYTAALLCMLIQAYGDPAFEPKLRQEARWLLESQMSDGTWTYSSPVPDSLFKGSTKTGALQISGGAPPDARVDSWKRLTPWSKETNGDNSCTQYALLGLQAVALTGIPLPSDLWDRSLKDALLRQATKSGGWDYRDTSETGGYGSMTAAGVCAVAMCRYQSGQRDLENDPAVARGLSWLDTHFDVAKHPGYSNPNDFVFYWLYSVERVGRMLDDDFIGIHEWYPEGAAWLVAKQQSSGLWSGLDGPEKDDTRLPTSFALLFLTRATPPLKPIVRHGPGTLRTAAVAPDNRFYIILDCSGSMLDNMDGKMKFDIARDAVRTMIDKLPPNSQVALRVYGHRKSALDPDCDLDTELKIPMGPLDKAVMNNTLNSLRSRGKTPLALSIKDAIQDIGDISADKPVTLVLLTDGGEDTIRPRGNPVKAAAELAKIKNLTFQIVGFDINQPDWSQQLQAMAQASGGRYWPAAREKELQNSVSNAVMGVPEQFALTDANGHALADGKFGQAISLPEGKYHFQTIYGGQTIAQDFYISPDEITSITFDASQVKPAPGDQAVAPTPPANTELLVNWPKFCTHCGAPLQPGQKFCTHCGAKVEPIPQK